MGKCSLGLPSLNKDFIIIIIIIIIIILEVVDRGSETQPHFSMVRVNPYSAACSG